MESFATGLKRIHDACEKVGVKVEYIGDEYWFTVRFYRHCGEGWGELDRLIDKNGQAKVQPHTQPHSVDGKIIAACTVPRSVSEIASEIGYKDRKTVRKHLKRLVEEGRILMTMPEKPNHPKQKYVAK